ncbi:hypothetical protein MMON44395_23685 [Mycolicibacterium monacense DSM 44395]|nr:hypothetical protein [Mycolicibacterium monacense DSM 44395]
MWPALIQITTEERHELVCLCCGHLIDVRQP